MENFTSDLLFIIIVLVGAAILGYLIGYYVNARYKKVIAAFEDLKKDMDDLKNQVADLAGNMKRHLSEYENMKNDLAGFKNNHHSEHESLKGDLAGYKEKHQSEYETLKNDLATEAGRIGELQKLASEVDGLKKKIADHSHEALAKELNDLRSRLAESD